jgi:rhodanese-related sulfurtransferase
MKSRILALLGYLLLMVNAACGQKNTANRLGHCVSPKFDKEVARWLDFKVPTVDVDSLYGRENKFLILDAREPGEFKVSHLPGAISCGYDKFSMNSLDSVAKDQPIMVYCSIGYRSERIAEKLKKQGFTQVYNLYGSIFEWGNRGYPLVDALGQPTQKLHTYNQLWARWVDSKRCERVH